MKRRQRFTRGIPLLQWLVTSVAFVAGTNAIAKDSPSMPTDVPPLLAMAMVSDAGNTDSSSQWRIRLALPKVRWQVVGEVVPKSQWPELKAEVETAIITLRMGGASALAPSQILDLKGNELKRDQVVKRLEKETAVLVSVSGRMPDAYYLQLTNPDTLIVILGPRDGVPAPGLLPAERASSTKKERANDQ